MASTVVRENVVVLERAHYNVHDADDMLRLLVWMQANARGDQIILVRAMWCFNALTRPMADSICRAAEASDMRLPDCYRDLVGPVARARKGNKEKVHLFFLSFEKS